jgi:uncharacterized membrane protein
MQLAGFTMPDRSIVWFVKVGLCVGIVVILVGLATRAGIAFTMRSFGVKLPPTAIVAACIFAMIVALNVALSFLVKRASTSSSKDNLSTSLKTLILAEEFGAIIIARGNAYTDRYRKYEVLLDELKIGELAAAGTFRHEVTAGHHTLSLKIDWGGSRPLEIDVNPGESLSFQAGNKSDINALPAFWYALFTPRTYLFLDRIR